MLSISTRWSDKWGLLQKQNERINSWGQMQNFATATPSVTIGAEEYDSADYLCILCVIAKIELYPFFSLLTKFTWIDKDNV